MSTSPPIKNTPLNDAESRSPSDSPLTTESAAGLRSVRSSDLFGADRELLIEHADSVYRLRITASGKLILTK